MADYATAILIVAPPTLQRQGLLATLREARPDFRLHATADLRALSARLRQEAPVLVILDAALPGKPLDDIIAQVRAAAPHQRILVLGGRRLPFRLSRLIVEMGGGMLLSKRATPEDLVAAVAELIGPGADAAEPTPVYQRRAATLPPVLFSPRELEVLHLVAEDLSSQEIAAQLSVSVRTVDAHRRTLLEKADARSVVGLVLKAVKQGWLHLG